MKWIKRGHIFGPGNCSWNTRRTLPPVPYRLNDDVLRIYCGFCDDHMVGRLGYVDVAADNPSKILGVSRTPLLDVGSPGAFDENGILPTCVIDVDGSLYLYYVGYQLGTQVRYYQFEGLAVSDDGGDTFRRRLRVPVTDRSDTELVNRTSAFVRRRGGIFDMWYVAGSEWTTVNGKSLPTYQLKYLTSNDGIHWPDTGRLCLDYQNDDEHAFGKPCVVDHNGIEKMIFSVRTRTKGYRLGYAESTNGLDWVRDDTRVGIDVSDNGWDSEMIAYGIMTSVSDRTFLFYNGNDLGATGFGWAELEEW
jgi:hypothetical protein